MALADLDALQIKMSYMSDCSQASLVSVSLDTADAYGQGETALDVEQCQCPPGYVGTSCEVSGGSESEGWKWESQEIGGGDGWEPGW